MSQGACIRVRAAGGRAPPRPTPEDTSSDDGVAWFELEREDEEEEVDAVSLSTGAMGTEAALQPASPPARARAALTFEVGVALAGEGVVGGHTCRGRRAARASLEEVQAPGVIRAVSIESCLSYLFLFG